ncbi:neuronal acetylcholine receptor subunit alpha-10-like isoform X1 [Daphnia carinata]|uniref:neuronal acetylcholine receptor subunit alpha-10-like isoform X1 n=1 Tax=Daphnia carinata TaxID=120202 RepID=UPI0025807C7D|nr:neuronal acetylcholine receptor subunit alpha-10-like isoform X1 [Daphnia carinata]
MLGSRKMAHRIWIAFVTVLAIPGNRGDDGEYTRPIVSHEYRLLQHLMANYDRSVRPSRNAVEPLNITFGLALTQIIDVDERNQILTTNCWMNQMWTDYSLVWNVSDFGGIRVVRIPADKVWKSDIILYNNADSEYNSALLSTNVIVTHDGNLTWLSSAIFKSSCGINVEYFPFDEQKCSMKFSSWTYDGLQVNLLNQAEEGDLSNYVPNGEWDLIDLVVERNVVFYSCCEEPYPDITFHIVLRRRPLFYVFNLILPCVLITGIALMSFYMPSDSGEKVTLGITTLLSMTVFLMVIGESMPPTSEKLPLIGLYYGVTISLVSFATGLSVVTLNIHHRGMRGRGVPPMVKKIVFGVLAKLLFIQLDIAEGCSCSTKAKEFQQNNQFEMNERFNVDVGDSLKNESNGSLPHRLVVVFVAAACLHFRGSSFGANSGLINSATSNIGPTDSFERQFLRVLNKVYQHIERSEARLADQDRKDVIKLEWQQVALVIDRFLLWIFIIATVAATFGILYMSPHSRLFSM